MIDLSSAEHAIGLAKAAGEVGKALFAFRKTLTKSEDKAYLDDIMDKLRDLKQQAAELEDQNRDLRDRLRFKNDDFEFKNPFWYEKTHPDRPLCARCFANEKVGPMGEERRPSGLKNVRTCLACREPVSYGALNPKGAVSNQRFSRR